MREILHGAGAGSAAAAALGPLLLGALGRGVMAGNAAQRARALPLLVDACDALRPDVKPICVCSRTYHLPEQVLSVISNCVSALAVVVC